MSRELVLLRVIDTGETPQVTGDAPASSHMKSDQVLIVIDDEQRKIWIWKGAEAPVRRKFIAARSASRIRDQRGLTYKIISEDQGQEGQDFLAVMGQRPTAKPDAVGISPAESPTETPPQPPPMRAETTVKPRTTIEPETKPNYTQVVVSGSRTTERRPVEVPRPPQAIIEAVERLETVPGFRREFVLIGFDAFAVTEEITKVLGKRMVKRHLKRIDSLPEGTVFAQGYTPRIVIQDGKVLAIEFLKRLEEEEYQHESTAKEEMLRQIADLVQSLDSRRRTKTKAK